MIINDQVLQRKSYKGSISPIYFPDEHWIRLNLPYIDSGYWVSDYGRIYSERIDAYLLPSYDGKRYQRVNLLGIDGKYHNVKVHRAVLGSFNPIPNMDQFIINHINGINDDNRLINLRWSNTDFTNIDKPSVSFSNEDAERVCYWLERGLTPIEIYNKLFLSSTYSKIDVISLIRNIYSKRAFQSISSKYKIESSLEQNNIEAPSSNRIFTSEQAKEIYRMINEGNYNYDEIMAHLGIIPTTTAMRHKYRNAIYNIRRGLTHRNTLGGNSNE